MISLHQGERLVPYDPHAHRAALIQRLGADQAGSKAAGIGSTMVADVLDTLEILPPWFAESRIITKNDEAVGLLTLRGITPEVKEAGIWLDPSERGNGLALRAASQAVRDAFTQNPKLVQIRQNVEATNHASVGLARKLGFKDDASYAATWSAFPMQMLNRIAHWIQTGNPVQALSLDRSDFEHRNTS